MSSPTFIFLYSFSGLQVDYYLYRDFGLQSVILKYNEYNVSTWLKLLGIQNYFQN